MTSQPHQLDIALALPLKPSARLDAIEISVNVDLQQRRRVISWPTRGKGRDGVKAELGEIQSIDEDIDRPHRIVLTHIVIQYRGKQCDLPAIGPLNKALHFDPRISPGIIARESIQTLHLQAATNVPTGRRNLVAGL